MDAQGRKVVAKEKENLAAAPERLIDFMDSIQMEADAVQS